jgi:hypothetical protein
MGSIESKNSKNSPKIVPKYYKYIYFLIPKKSKKYLFKELARTHFRKNACPQESVPARKRASKKACPQESVPTRKRARKKTVRAKTRVVWTFWR